MLRLTSLFPSFLPLPALLSFYQGSQHTFWETACTPRPPVQNTLKGPLAVNDKGNVLNSPSSILLTTKTFSTCCSIASLTAMLASLCRRGLPGLCSKITFVRIVWHFHISRSSKEKNWGLFLVDNTVSLFLLQTELGGLNSVAHWCPQRGSFCASRTPQTVVTWPNW